MSKRKDRERAKKGLLFRDGKLVDVVKVLDVLIPELPCGLNVSTPKTILTPAEVWAMRKALEEEEKVKALLGRKGIVLLRPPKKVSEEEVKNGTE